MPPSMRPGRREPEGKRPASRPARERQEHGARGDRPARGEGAARGGGAARGDGGVWFTINVGRSKHADPKWLIPLLCRRGGITKREIGKIEILMRETRVEIRPDASERFAEAVRRPDEKDRNIHIERVEQR